MGPGAFWEIAGRYATIDPTDLVSGNDRKETGGAISYYYNRHNLKVQADFRQIEDDAANSGARDEEQGVPPPDPVHFLSRRADVTPD